MREAMLLLILLLCVTAIYWLLCGAPHWEMV